MDKCPCKNCITYAICKGSKICRLFEKCEMILAYVQDMDSVTAAIKTIQPPYANYALPTVQYNADIILSKAKTLRKFNHYLK